jgi:3-methyladenine DNA glycosylase/8-oxoguanine DNA glycosylase
MLPITSLSFDLAVAMQHLAAKDERLAELIQSTQQFQLDEVLAESPYEALLEAIAYQSISGKAAATIFARIKPSALPVAPPPHKYSAPQTSPPQTGLSEKQKS